MLNLQINIEKMMWWVMELRELRRDIENGAVKTCQIDSVSGRWVLRAWLQNGDSDLLESQREGVRKFATIEAAAKAAQSAGMRSVTVNL